MLHWVKGKRVKLIFTDKSSCATKILDDISMNELEYWKRNTLIKKIRYAGHPYPRYGDYICVKMEYGKYFGYVKSVRATSLSGISITGIFYKKRTNSSIYVRYPLSSPYLTEVYENLSKIEILDHLSSARIIKMFNNVV